MTGACNTALIKPKQAGTLTDTYAALQAARASAGAAGITCIVHSEIGVPAEAITGLAETIACDEIVMGTYGRGALNEFLVGSITLKVVQLAKVPVLLVK